MSDEPVDAHWVELIQGPLDGCLVSWDGKPGDSRTFRTKSYPAEHVNPENHSVHTLGRDEADALKGTVPDKPGCGGWEKGWCEVVGVCPRGNNPTGAVAYTLMENERALYEYPPKR